MRTQLNPALFIAGLGLVLAVVSDVAGQANFQGLGDLPGGIVSSRAFDISDDGSTIVGQSNSVNGPEAFKWSGGVMIGLGDLPGGLFDSLAHSVNADGSVIVGRSIYSTYTGAFRWDASGMVGLGMLPGDTSSVAWGVSDDGEAISGYSILGTPSSYSHVQAVRWDVGVITLLRDLPGGPDNSAAHAMSADGAVVAGRGTVGFPELFQYEACRWNRGRVEAVALGDLPGGNHESQVLGMSADGSIMVGLSASASSTQESGQGEACIWIDSEIVALGDLAGGGLPDAIAWDVSDDGQVIVGRGTSVLGSEAFIWTKAHGMRNLRQALTSDYGLDLSTWILLEARGISANGRNIAGFGTNVDGNTEGWLVRLPCAADISPVGGDGQIDVSDLVALIVAWGPCRGCTVDINDDGQVNVEDLVVVVVQWGPCE